MWLDVNNTLSKFIGNDLMMFSVKNEGREYDVTIYTDKPLKYKLKKNKIRSTIKKEGYTYDSLRNISIERVKFPKKRLLNTKFDNLIYSWMSNKFPTTSIAYKLGHNADNIVLNIFSNRPGVLIGKAGTEICALKKYLSDNGFNCVVDIWEAIPVKFIDPIAFQKAWDDYEYGHGF